LDDDGVPTCDNAESILLWSQTIVEAMTAVDPPEVMDENLNLILAGEAYIAEMTAEALCP
jgi:hypothetical protein